MMAIAESEIWYFVQKWQHLKLLETVELIKISPLNNYVGLRGDFSASKSSSLCHSLISIFVSGILSVVHNVWQYGVCLQSSTTLLLFPSLWSLSESLLWLWYLIYCGSWTTSSKLRSFNSCSLHVNIEKWKIPLLLCLSLDGASF